MENTKGKEIRMTRLSNRDEGFSLIECMVSMGVMLFLMASVFHVLGKYQRGYQNEQATTDMRQGARGAMELLSQEVGQKLQDRKSTRLNSSHRCISYAVFCL